MTPNTENPDPNEQLPGTIATPSNIPGAQNSAPPTPSNSISPQVVQPNNQLTPSPVNPPVPLAPPAQASAGAVVSDFTNSPTQPVASVGSTVGPAGSQQVGTQPAIFTGSNESIDTAQPKKKKIKYFVIAIIVVFVLAGGAAAAYFGYWMNPSFVYKQSLGDSNKAYAKLINYLNTDSQTHYKTINENGSFQVSDGGTSFNGSLIAASDGKNSSVSAKLDIGVANFDLEERGITQTNATAPDVYLQLTGLKTADKSFLNGELGPKIDSLDGRWIVIDHNLIIDIKDEIAKAEKANSSPQLTWSDANSFLQAAGKANQNYLFTTNKDKGVLSLVKTYGRQQVDGHDTYHYKVAINPAHAQAYVIAMCSALQTSGLGSYIRAETGSNIGASSTCKSLEKSAGKIKPSDTIDIWADVHTRLIYKVRLFGTSNPAENFIDLGLNYKGGNIYPFFISGQSKNGSDLTSYNITTTLNSTENSLKLGLNVADKSASTSSLTGSFVFKPSNTNVSVQAPTGAIPITTVLSDFGLQNYVKVLQSSANAQQLISFKTINSAQSNRLPIRALLNQFFPVELSSKHNL